MTFPNPSSSRSGNQRTSPSPTPTILSCVTFQSTPPTIAHDHSANGLAEQSAPVPQPSLKILDRSRRALSNNVPRAPAGWLAFRPDEPHSGQGRGNVDAQSRFKGAPNAPRGRSRCVSGGLSCRTALTRAASIQLAYQPPTPKNAQETCRTGSAAPSNRRRPPR